MIQRDRRHTPATLNRLGDHAERVASPTLRRELLAKVAGGARTFVVADPESVVSVAAFQNQVRALESLEASGLIMIGARELATQSTDVLAIRRIRLTEAGKRRANLGQSG